MFPISHDSETKRTYQQYPRVPRWLWRDIIYSKSVHELQIADHQAGGSLRPGVKSSDTPIGTGRGSGGGNENGNGGGRKPAVTFNMVNIRRKDELFQDPIGPL